jgi:hypothetical protein
MSDQPAPRFAILTLAIGADFKRDLGECLKSKREYAARHGYTYVEAGEEYWDRDRPIAWSKVPFWLDFLRRQGSAYDYIWLSDADVYITNPSIPLTAISRLMGSGHELLMNVDAWGNVNSGNMLIRPGAWAIDFLERVWRRTESIYHIWFENKAIIDEYSERPTDAARIFLNKDHALFNAYLNGLPGASLWTPGCFLVHFAGVYDTSKMAAAVTAIKHGEVPRISPAKN